MTDPMPVPQPYVDREMYRRSLGRRGFVSTIDLSELYIIADAHWQPLAAQAHRESFSLIEHWLQTHPSFGGLVPLPDDPAAPHLIRAMILAAEAAGVGPMAAVAGAIAQSVGQALVQAGAEQVIVENGGDLYLHVSQPVTLAVFAGQSPLSMQVGLTIPAGTWGCATSSGTVGPSLSFGRADAAMVLARDARLADACATRLGNEIHTSADLGQALNLICNIPGITGAVAILDDQIGAVGAVSLVALTSHDGQAVAQDTV